MRGHFPRVVFKDIISLHPTLLGCVLNVLSYGVYVYKNQSPKRGCFQIKDPKLEYIIKIIIPLCSNPFCKWFWSGLNMLNRYLNTEPNRLFGALGINYHETTIFAVEFSKASPLFSPPASPLFFTSRISN